MSFNLVIKHVMSKVRTKELPKKGKRHSFLKRTKKKSKTSRLKRKKYLLSRRRCH